MTGKSFLTSKQWREVQKKLGRRAWFYDGALAIEHHLPFGKKYILINLESYSPEEVKKITDALALSRAVFLRLNFLSPFKKDKRKKILKTGFTAPPYNYYFSATTSSPLRALLNLEHQEETLLKHMKKKTRYNIKLARRKGVDVVHGSFHDFWQLLQETARRHKIKTHAREHFQALLDVFGGDIKILTAEYKKEPVASALILHYGNTATYLHGGSDEKHKNFMPAYLLQWHAIKEAKKAGLKFYDFGGITDEEEHPWRGITRFKFGFGAEETRLLGAYDLPLSKFWYGAYKWRRRR